MTFTGTLYITDPCYFVDGDSDWDETNYGHDLDRIGLKNYLIHSTIYGDWGCTTFAVAKKQNMPALAEKLAGYMTNNQNDKIDKLLASFLPMGQFTADTGQVGVFLESEVIAYNPNFHKFIHEHPKCVTIIPDFAGEVEIAVNDDIVNVIGWGNKNFITVQTSL